MLERELISFIPFSINQSLDQALVGNKRAKKTDLDTNNRIRYPDPSIKVNDTVKIDLATGKIQDFIRFDTGVIAMVTGGRNMGRVGVITHRERHDGGFNIVHIKDAIDNSFATRESNVFIIGKEKPWISLPKGKGVKVCRIPIISYDHRADWLRSCRSQRREIVVALLLLLGIRLPQERVERQCVRTGELDVVHNSDHVYQDSDKAPPSEFKSLFCDKSREQNQPIRFHISHTKTMQPFPSSALLMPIFPIDYTIPLPPKPHAHFNPPAAPLPPVNPILNSASSPAYISPAPPSATLILLVSPHLA